ncbi:uncharacterized protein EI97DRAFT_373906 [Westerdykella ornata]|uniref:Uncharacterized protein n=1 Tax=Westerdykella ornata TaxID=318751 RepID=A0A6A6JNJ5_WESOR|nr:uncharacterized protein EI97DRAFT_373906 [Westerdykella ornata]KAF2277824.1 hypothetical protein EI97DRAFT_373906 [Westerdykella ornata]
MEEVETSIWDTMPNDIASELAASKNRTEAGQAIRESLRDQTGQAEPLYALRDAEIRDTHWQVMDRIQRFAIKYFGFDFPQTEENEPKLNTAFAQMREETVTLIGCVASGGPEGSQGWKDLFYDSVKRKALVCAIIGNIVTEQVIQHSFFGGSKTDEDALDGIMRDNTRLDGEQRRFDRNALYAEYIAQALDFTPGESLTLPTHFHQHVVAVVATLLVHLTAVDARNVRTAEHRVSEQIRDLYKLVAYAGILSLFMRLDPQAVYYVTPTFKEQHFEAEHMDAYNRAVMEATNPRERMFPDDWDQREIARAKNDEPLTQMILMNGITVYRRGGWEDPDISEPWDEGVVYQPGMEHRGIRSRQLTQAWVFCRWGRPRRFVKGQPADRKEVHGAQWRDPGSVEFEDVVAEAKGGERGEEGETLRGRRKEKERVGEGRREKGKGKARA